MGKSELIANLRCSSPKCEHSIQLAIAALVWVDGLAGVSVNHALEVAATLLGWRRDITPIGPLYRDRDDLRPTSPIYCPKHASKLVCARCGERECFCMGGPRFDARQG